MAAPTPPPAVHDQRQVHNAARVEVEDKKVLPVSMLHLDQFVRWDCSVELLRMKLFPNAQEITESVGCLAAADTKAGLKFSDADVTCVVVGDGSRPRTAALACCRTKWRRVISIDPDLSVGTRAADAWKVIDRLESRRAKIEDTTIDIDPALDRTVVIILPHAHVPPNKAIGALRFPASAGTPGESPPPAVRLVVVQLPCCDYEWHDRCAGAAPDADYTDVAIASCRRRVRVWGDVMPAVWGARGVAVGDSSAKVETGHPQSCSVERARGWRNTLPDRQSSAQLVDAASWEGVALVLCKGMAAADASRRTLRKRQYAKAFGDAERRVVSGRILKVPMLQARLLTRLSDPAVKAEYAEGPPDTTPPTYPEAVARELLEIYRRTEEGEVDAPVDVPPDAGALDDAGIRALATRHSVPRWIVRHMAQQCGGRGAAAFCGLLNTPAEVSLRVNFHRRAGLTRHAVVASLRDDGIAAYPHPFVPTSVRIGRDDGKANIKASKMWREGYVEVQDTGSQLLAAAALPREVLARLQADSRAADATPEHAAKRVKLSDPSQPQKNSPPGRTLRVLDYCCGLGGKTLQLASLCGGGAGACAVDGYSAFEIVAADIDEAALRELPTRLRRCGLEGCVVTRIHPLRACERAGTDGEATAPLNWGGGKDAGSGAAGAAPQKRVTTSDGGGAASAGDPGLFDVVFVDAPCSGLGRLRRRTDNRWRLPRSDLDTYPALQLRILTEAAAFVATGGTLCYATCSMNRGENEDVTTAFAASPSGAPFRPDPLVNAWGAGVCGELGVDPAANSLTFYPHVHDTDGFYIERWVREG